MSLYRAYFVPGATDPSGGYQLRNRRGITLKQKFNRWLELETADAGWWRVLPKCPCKIQFDEFGNPNSPDEKVWIKPRRKRDFPATAKAGKLEVPILYGGLFQFGTVDTFTNPPDLHPGAVWDMRSKRDKKHAGNFIGNQCMYDAEGKLITSGLGAGTVDKRYYGEVDYSNFFAREFAEATDKYRHWHHDVIPFWAAWLLDGKTYGANVSKYLKVRPSYNLDGCEENEVGGTCETE